MTKATLNKDQPQLLMVVLTTCPDSTSAERLTQILLDQQLAACISIVTDVMSHYYWQGKRERSQELLLLIKTPPHLVEHLINCIIENHPYQAPEILLLQTLSSSPAYNEWVKQVCLQPSTTD